MRHITLPVVALSHESILVLIDELVDRIYATYCVRCKYIVVGREMAAKIELELHTLLGIEGIIESYRGLKVVLVPYMRGMVLLPEL